MLENDKKHIYANFWWLSKWRIFRA